MENDIFSKLILHRGSGRRQVTRNHKFVVFVFLIMRSLVSVCLAKIKIPCKNIRLIESRHRVAGIIVYSVKENRSWKIRNAKTMMADPSATQFAVNGITISAPINIAGIALGPEIRTSNDRVVVNEDREVYFCPLSSQHLYSVNTTVLRDENRAPRRPRLRQFHQRHRPQAVADGRHGHGQPGHPLLRPAGQQRRGPLGQPHALLVRPETDRARPQVPRVAQLFHLRPDRQPHGPDQQPREVHLRQDEPGRVQLPADHVVRGREKLLVRQLQLRLARWTLVPEGTHQPGAASSATPGASAAARTHIRRTP
jgi:hypothetical protein